MLGVADLTDGRATREEHATHLRARHAQDRVVALLGHELDRGTRRASHRGTLARLQLDRVDDRTDGDVGERQRVARLDVGVRAGHHRVADLETLGGEDVALLTVGVVQQGDAGRAIRVVLDRGDLGRDRRPSCA